MLYHRLGVRFYDIQIRACHLFKGMIVYLQWDLSLFVTCLNDLTNEWATKSFTM